MARGIRPFEYIGQFLEARKGSGQSAPFDDLMNPIETRTAITKPVDCDPRRIAQVASNLVANAAKHGAPNGPIRVSASTDEKGFELTVANEGEPIDEIVAQQLFQPFFRGNAHSSNQGLGLGLYIASEIARAHGGKITVASSKEETRFTLHIPPA